MALGPVTDVSLVGCASRPMQRSLPLARRAAASRPLSIVIISSFWEGIVLWSPVVAFAVSVLHELLFFFVLHQIFFRLTGSTIS